VPSFALFGFLAAFILLANYFFMPETLVLSLAGLQNSKLSLLIAMNLQGFQGVKQCFASSIAFGDLDVRSSLDP
jgi:hypothetical protein